MLTLGAVDEGLGDAVEETERADDGGVVGVEDRTEKLFAREKLNDFLRSVRIGEAGAT